MEDQEPFFTSTKHLQGFATHHRMREHLPEPKIPAGTKCWLERNARTKLTEAELETYTILPVPNDYTGIGKYMNIDSFAMVKVNGRPERWPLTMIFFEK